MQELESRTQGSIQEFGGVRRVGSAQGGEECEGLSGEGGEEVVS